MAINTQSISNDEATDRDDAMPVCGEDFEHEWNLNDHRGPYCGYFGCDAEMSWAEWHGLDEHNPDLYTD